LDAAQILQNKEGAVNMHLEVDFGQENTMAMLYKVRNGYVQEQHYGLAIARVVDLPPQVLQVAEQVSRALEAQAAAKKQSSKSLALAKRRKLVKSLKEQLEQAAKGSMDDKALTSWLVGLQTEFVLRMDAIDTQIADSDAEGDGSSEVGVAGDDGSDDDEERRRR